MILSCEYQYGWRGTEEEDGDGYVNYIYRVQTPKESLVLKQERISAE